MTRLSQQTVPDHESRQLAQRLADLFGIPARITVLENRLERLSDQIAGHGTILQGLSQAEEQQNRLLRASVEKQECLESASRQQALLTEVHYQQHVLDPLTRQVFPLIDDLHDVLEEAQVDAPVQTLLQGLKAQLLDLLATHGIEEFLSQPGDPFDAACMRPVKRVRVFRPDEDRTVSRVLKVGFMRGETFLRHQSIEVCIYRSPNPVLSQTQGN